MKKKFNLKNYWREILIGILIALLLWVSSADRPTQTIGSSDTVCVTDTVTRNVPSPVRVEWRKILLSRTDTIYENLSAYDTTVIVRIDTSWLYADVPVNEYRDTSYYVKTIGWMDSISVFVPKCITTSPDHPITRSPDVTIFGNTHLGNGVVAPGVSISVKRLQLGYNYNVINQSSLVTVGYRIR